MNWNVPEALKANAELLYQSAETWNISFSTDSDIKVFTVYTQHTHFLYYTKSSYFHFTIHMPDTSYSGTGLCSRTLQTHTCSSYTEHTLCFKKEEKNSRSY